jgi:uncharacterized damage-inducible protein DinB
MEIHSIEPFLAYVQSVRRRTRVLVEHIPPERLEWSPGPGRFTPGDLVRHIAGAERWMWAENARLKPSRYPGHGSELASGSEEVLRYMDRLHDETVEILGALTPQDLEARCVTVGGAEMRVWKWLRLMVEHEIHHRGQLYELLARLGVETPPLYGLTESQVRERSQAGEV